ncbi:MAG: hypothetical protein IJB52_14335 [Clostridia bacterium]|nr:hypothetical protein [Clostridia bacterium]
MTELIFMEGVSGVGKSTMTRMLAEELTAEGHTVRAYLEFDFTNPIDFYCTAYLTAGEYAALCREYPEEADKLRRYTIHAGEAELVRYFDEDTPLFPEPLLTVLRGYEFCYHPKRLVSLEAYTEAYRHVWRNFAAGLDGTYDYILFDGSLLHHPINDMMRNYGCPGETALGHVSVLLAALGDCKRRIFYLEPENIGMQLAVAHRDRGQAEPDEQQIAFWERRCANDHYVLDRIREDRTVYNVTKQGWDNVRQQIRCRLTDRGTGHGIFL